MIWRRELAHYLELPKLADYLKVTSILAVVAALAPLAILISVVTAACGGSPSTPSPPPTNPYTITITAARAVSPKELAVPPGTRVLFINNDSRRHDVASDPHPEHNAEGCGGINQVGLLNPGQSRETGNLVQVRTCGYHDHEDPDNESLKGRIEIR